MITIVVCFCSSQTNQNDKEKIKLAAKNIIDQLHVKTRNKIILVNSKNKWKITNVLITELRVLNVSVTQFHPNSNPDSLEILSSLIKENVDNQFFIFLIDPSDAPFLFKYAGRPDMGLKIPDKKLFCDWLMPEDQFVRLNSINIQENNNYQKKLRTALNTVDTIKITTKTGTNIKFIARNWINDKGEIYCTPIESKTDGVIMIDGSAYWGPPSKPILLQISNGKVINTDSLSETDKQEKMMKKDFTMDKNASILSEVGIGTNKNALWNSDIMESEQARGTCHFGFGMNLNYGGEIKSTKHFDLVILNPSIEINHTLVYEEGILK
jgi:hypothetical protein